MIEERNDKSLCEKSMKMVVNIIKLSSFSIAKMSLGTKSLTPAAATDYSDMIDTDQLLHDQTDQFPAAGISQMSSEKLQSRSSKPYSSYVMQPTEPGSGGNESMMVHGDQKRVRDSDWIFADYIRKVHEKNRSNSREASKLSPYILPPPPTPLTRRN